MLEELKVLVMEQARMKGFGTNPQEINVAEKLLLIGTEIEEAERIMDSVHSADRRDRNFFQQYEFNEGGFSWLYCFSRVYRFRTSHSRPHLQEYETEWGDVLQRTLHLGGVFGYEFPDLEIYPQVSVRGTHERGNKASRLVLATGGHYRKKRMYDFERGLVDIAHYCMAVAQTDRFDIEQVVLDKIAANMGRDWNPAQYHEQFANS